MTRQTAPHSGPATEPDADKQGLSLLRGGADALVKEARALGRLEQAANGKAGSAYFGVNGAPEQHPSHADRAAAVFRQLARAQIDGDTVVTLPPKGAEVPPDVEKLLIELRKPVG